MQIRISLIDKLSYLYLSIPLLIFLASWIRVEYAIISILSVVLILFFIFKKDCDNTETFFINKKTLYLLSVIAILYCILAGIGGLHFQSADWHLRNAVFRDLIQFDFPVTYSNNSKLVYYMGFWLLPTSIGKLIYFFTNDLDISFNIANIINLLFSAFGILLIMLQLLVITKAKNSSRIFTAIFLLIFFSGLDILMLSKLNIHTIHLERHIQQYSSNMTLLFWVHNQTIMPWLITLLFIKNFDNVRNFAYFTLLCLFYAPFPFIGISFYTGSACIIQLVKNIKYKKLQHFFKDVFSLPNILTLLFVFPIIVLYYKSSYIVDSKLGFMPFSRALLKFIMLEVGLYLIIIFKSNIKNPIFYLTLIQLLIYPFVRHSDLCMRASIPALFVLMVLVIIYINTSTDKLLRFLLIALLGVGMCTPLVELYRGFYAKYSHCEVLVKDRFKTLDGRITIDNNKYTRFRFDIFCLNYTNFLNYGTPIPEQTVFFKYIAKNKTK